MTRILLVRHGESVTNLKKVFAGHLDIDLTERGMEQAKCTARFIKDNYKVDKIYTSDLIRAYNTGKALADISDLEIETDSGLREVDAGVWENMPFDEIVEKYGEEFKLWITETDLARPTGGESATELAERIDATLRKIAKANDGKTIVVVSHSTPIRIMRCLVTTNDFHEMKNTRRVSNASVSVLDYNDGKWSFAAIGLDQHLKEIKTKPHDAI